MISNLSRRRTVSSILVKALPAVVIAALSSCAVSAESPAEPADQELTGEAAQALSAPPALSSWIHLPAWHGDANIMLLTDGRVMGMNSDGTIWALTPASDGKYESGTWTQLASMHDGRLYYGSKVLPDGRVMVVGGEDGTGNGKGEVYDPAVDAWTQQFTSPGAADTETALLPNGTVYVAWNSTVYNPSTNTVTAGTPFPNGAFDEASFVLLPDQSTLTILNSNDVAYRYVPSTATFVPAGTIPPGGLYDEKTEIGPGLLIPGGKVFWIGGNGKTAIYTPPTTQTGTGSWVAGPPVPDGFRADDAPAILMRNGHILFLADFGHNADGTSGFGGPTKIYEYDPVANVMSPGATAFDGAAFGARMLAVPTGQVLLSTGGDGYLYTPPAGGSTWAPTIRSVSSIGQGLYQISGTNLNGISEGAAYGDDAEMSSNYPLVRFECGSTVTYARTRGWAPGVVGLSASTQVTNFNVPSGASGACSLVAVANGIPSAPMAVTVTNGVISTGSGGEPCTPAKTITGGQSGNFNTSGPYCFRTPDVIHGWGCSNFDGRTLQVNGKAASCGTLPIGTPFNGYTYFNASAGTYPWASIYWW